MFDTLVFFINHNQIGNNFSINQWSLTIRFEHREILILHWRGIVQLKQNNVFFIQIGYVHTLEWTIRDPNTSQINQYLTQRHTQQDGNRNQSMKIPLQSSSGSYANSRCHLYFCSHVQSWLHRFVWIALERGKNPNLGSNL